MHTLCCHAVGKTLLMGDHFKDIYANQAERYDQMVSREDQRGYLFAALTELVDLSGAVVVDLGAGTGRITRWMTFMAQQVIALDIAPSMLQVARTQLAESGMENWSLAVGDHQHIPLADNSADVVIEGWSWGHTVGWHPDDWPARIDAMIAESERVLKPDGILILIETLGTGNRQPAPPSEHLAAFYRWLEDDRGFAHRWVRTDYQFEDIDEADTLTRFFFGDELADTLRTKNQLILPECTGIWWRHRGA